MAAQQTVEQAYAYPFASSLISRGDGSRLALAATGTPVEERQFFSGKLRRPELAAHLLLAASEVALQRYYVPPAMVARIIRAADPVVTASGERLRFESFSQCCGVYARVDLLPDMIDAETFGKGTTNVDFNPPMRAALSQIRGDNPVGLDVTSDKLSIDSDLGSAMEHKVKLPVRWLKGFAELHVLAAGLEPFAMIPGPAARRFLAALPRQVRAKDKTWLLTTSTGLRLGQRPGAGAMPAAGLGRLAVLRPLARFADHLNVYASTTGVSGFELDFGSARFLAVLSAAPSRGFSGEGQLLRAFVTADAGAALAAVRAQLSWQPLLRAASMATELGKPEDQIRTALGILATEGQVGFDPHEQGYFHRVLPLEMNRIEKLHPRLESARALLADGKVFDLSSRRDLTRAVVGSGDMQHRVRFDDDAFHCTCQWHARTLGESGPCKHVLAAMLAHTGV